MDFQLFISKLHILYPGILSNEIGVLLFKAEVGLDLYF